MMAENRSEENLVAMEMIEIGLNFEGQDYTVVVELEQANILLNDPDAADRFMRHELHLDAIEGTNDTEALDEVPNILKTKPSGSRNLVWSTKKPSAFDNEATEVFLKLTDKYSDKFNDRKTQKCQIWLQIVKDMNSAGYLVGDGKEAMEKVRLKFANLQKQYLNYMKHINTTGERKKDPPMFYELLHAILGTKEKVNPSHVDDSESDMSTATDNETQPTPTEIKSRFRSQRAAQLTPTSANSKLCELMKEQHEADRTERREQFQKLENILQQQNRQREEFLETFKRLVDVKGKKRRHSASSDENA